MCDYSLHHVASRSAKISDKLVTTELARAGTRGFAAVGELGAKLVIHDDPPKVAVCLLPGTELAFEDDVVYDHAFSLLGKGRVNHKVARFREIDGDEPHVRYDALEFPDGQVLRVARLVPGQTATVLQLPVAIEHHEHVERVGPAPESRIYLDRVSCRSGMASILVPNQGAVMLWQSFRSTASALSSALVRSLRRLTVQKQHPIPAEFDAEPIEASFKTDGLTVALPKKSTAQGPGKKIEVGAAA
jgi:hypothetical protein